jgi:hypothetical protein
MAGFSQELVKNFGNFVNSIPPTMDIETVCFDVNKGINHIATGDENLGKDFKIWE